MDINSRGDLLVIFTYWTDLKFEHGVVERWLAFSRFNFGAVSAWLKRFEPVTVAVAGIVARPSESSRLTHVSYSTVKSLEQQGRGVAFESESGSGVE